MHDFHVDRCIGEALREDQQLLEFLLDKIPVGISVLKGSDHRIELANQTAQTMLGREQLVGRPFAEILPALAGGRSIADLVYQTGEAVRVIETEVSPFHQQHRSFWNIDLIPLPEVDGSIGGVLVLALDVTEGVLLRRRAEGLNTELMRANAHLQGILQQLPVGVLISDETGRIILANEQARWLCRHPDRCLPAQEPGGEDLNSGAFCPTEGQYSPIELPLKRSLVTGAVLVNEEVSLRYADDTSRTVLCNTAPLRDLTGETLGAVCIFRDITVIKEAEQAREASLNNLQSLLRVTTEIMAESTLESLTRRIADAARELTGSCGAFAACGRAEGVFRASAASWAAGYPPPAELDLLSTAPADQVLDLLSHGGLGRLSVEDLSAAKPYSPEAAPSRPLIGALLSGREQGADGLIVVCGHPGTDLSEADETVLAQLAAVASLRVQNLEVLQELERQISVSDAVLENMGEGLVVLDADQRILFGNEIARDLLRLEQDETCGTALAGLNLMNLDDQPLAVPDHPLTGLLRGRQFEAREYLLPRPDGSRRRVIFSGSSVRDNEGGVGLIILTCRDVTALRELEQTQLDFLRVISHELRQPLTVIMAQAQLLARVADHPDRAGRCAQAISTSAWRMNAMIQDLVDSARMESGQLRLKRRPADLALIAQDLLERIKVSLDASRIKLQAPEALPRIMIDTDRFERVLTNLLTNALKYSAPETWIELGFESTGPEVLIKVADKGRGIAPEDLPHIFERYYRSREVRDLEEGLGLGLYITKGLVEAHGGRIWAESALGLGTTFFLAFPVDPG